MKEKEEIPADPESHGMNEDAPCDYRSERFSDNSDFDACSSQH